MWVVNGQVRISSGGLLMEALLLAGAYTLRVWAVARYMQGVRERAFGVPIAKPADRAATRRCVGTTAGVENHFECRCFGYAAHRRSGIVVLQRLPIRQSRGLGETPLSGIPFAAAWRLRANGSAGGCFFF